MQPRLLTCENTLKWVSEQAIPSPEHSFVTRRFPVFRGTTAGQSVDVVIQVGDRPAASSGRYASTASTPDDHPRLAVTPGSTRGNRARDPRAQRSATDLVAATRRYRCVTAKGGADVEDR